jgi:hypothetical protein
MLRRRRGTRGDLAALLLSEIAAASQSLIYVDQGTRVTSREILELAADV